MTPTSNEHVQRPGELTESFAELLCLTKRELLDRSGVAGQMLQTGAVYLDGSIDFPASTAPLVDGEALIETFVIDRAGELMATGMDDEFIAAWTPAATQLAALVISALAALDIELDGDAFLTASTTPGGKVEGECHFDDDLLTETENVGVVAIVGEIDGPRIACAPIGHGTATPGLPVPVNEQAFADFHRGDLPLQHAEAGRITLFPQFGQLHAGPALSDSDPTAVRNLMVLRARVKPRP